MTRDELAGKIAEAALLRGEFTLRSGRTSKYYLDKYLFTTKPALLAELAKLIAQRVCDVDDAVVGAAGGAGVNRLAGAELGGIPIVTAVGMATDLPFVFVRNQKKDYGTAKQLEGELQAGDRVILVEDIATTGGQAVEAIETLRQAGAEVLAVIAAIDRQEGARENVEGAGCRFEAIFTKAELGVDE